MTDHVPLVPAQRLGGAYAYNPGEESSTANGLLGSFAFGCRYIQAIIQTAERFA